MDVSQNEIPQLAVEVENVQRNINAHASIEIEKQVSVSESSSEIMNTGQNPLITNPDPNLPITNPDVNAMAETKKIDVEFGSMETIPLELSIQEGICSEEAPGSAEEFSQKPSDTGMNDLSKYFNADNSKQENKDAEGINFFNTLAEKVDQLKDDDPFSNIAEKKESPLETASNKKEIKSTIDTSENGQDTSNPTPILLKFFSEDKSGKDKDGKAFFDKISEDKVHGAFPALEVIEPILETPATDYFLHSPSSNSEIEEAWMPSNKTRQILVSIITSNVPFSPDINDLTMPGVIIEEDMEDPVKALLIECNSPFAHQRKALTASDVSEDEDGLKKLMENKCYHAAINLTKKLLNSFGQGLGCDGKPSNHTPLSLKLWYTRLALLVKLKKYSFAEVESAAFGNLDKPDLYYEFYPDIYKGKRGTMVPFALRLLLAELPQYQGNHQAALDNMYHILNIIQKMLNNVQNGRAEDGSMLELSESRKAASLEIWSKREKRVLFSILNCVLTQKDYILAVTIANSLIEKSGSDTAQLHSALGRIYLQLGDVQIAETYFRKASFVAEKNSQDFRIEENINNALLAVACDENDKAYRYFEEAYLIHPNAMLMNNMAVCKLYTGQLKESLKLLETALHKNPTSYLHDGLLFNVCTLYELESSRCPQKKLAMLELVSKYVGDSFNVSCLKIQPAKG